MAAHNYDDLVRHAGHQVVVVTYGTPAANVAVECETCSEVLLDFDRPGQDEFGQATAYTKEVLASEPDITKSSRDAMRIMTAWHNLRQVALNASLEPDQLAEAKRLMVDVTQAMLPKDVSRQEAERSVEKALRKQEQERT